MATARVVCQGAPCEPPEQRRDREGAVRGAAVEGLGVRGRAATTGCIIPLSWEAHRLCHKFASISAIVSPSSWTMIAPSCSSSMNDNRDFPLILYMIRTPT
eukprot:48416-Pleurochrysis_carterae.AAC.3